jgi:hypothetical protein
MAPLPFDVAEKIKLANQTAKLALVLK